MSKTIRRQKNRYAKRVKDTNPVDKRIERRKKKYKELAFDCPNDPRID